jgi:PAS domain S-box-containing protein
MKDRRTLQQLEAELKETQSRLEEAEETLRAIQNNEVDALVIDGPQGQQVYTLQGAEQPYRTLMETMSEGALTMAADGTILYCNGHFSELIRMPLNNIMGESLYDFVISPNGQSLETMLRECGREGCRQEFFLKTANGEKVPVSLSARSLTLGEAEAFCIVVTDLTEQKGIQGMLEKTRDLLEERVAERTAQLSQTNAALQAEISERKLVEERILRQTALLQGINRIFHGAITSESEEELGSVCLSVAEELTGSAIGFIGEIHPDGQLYGITISDPGWGLCAINDKNGHSGLFEPFQIHGLYGQVIRTGKSLLSNDPASHPQSIGLPKGHPPLTAFLGVPMIEKGQTIGIIAVGNREAGYSLEQQQILEALAPAVVQVFLRMRAEEAVRKSRDELELRVQERTEELSQAYERLKEETRERGQLEQQLIQTQKLEALGTLSGGIAHDFNNILAGIIGFTEMVMEDAAPDGPEYRRLEMALKGANRGRDLVKQILSFSRQTGQDRAPLNLSSIVKEGLQLLRPALPSTIEIVSKNSTADDRILADPVQMHQILMNLCTNAAHAMREKGGMLDIDISKVSVADGSFAPTPEMSPGEYVVLQVRDTGTGMTPEVLERIFDPFFTTKQQGEGTGLGLSVVHGIAKSHGGHVSVESEPGKGSLFRVYLPKVEIQVLPGVKEAPSAAGGSERILFVDDEDLLVELNRERLTRLGYDVIATTRSMDALDMFRKEPDRFDLVITDQTMPNLTGMDLAAELLKIKATIPIILCTGHSDSLTPERAQAAGIKAFLMKPLGRYAMAEAVRRVLDGVKPA